MMSCTLDPNLSTFRQCGEFFPHRKTDAVCKGVKSYHGHISSIYGHDTHVQNATFQDSNWPFRIWRIASHIEDILLV